VVCVAGALTPERLAAIVAAESAPTDVASEIRYDEADRRFALRQVPIDAPAAATFAPRQDDAVVWITGGAGGLGAQFARWFAGRGVRRIVLSGRRPAVPPSLPGVDVRYRCCDVADPAQVRATVQWIAEELGPLRGIVHAAGVLHDGYLFKQDDRNVDAVFAAKVGGLLHIDEATRDTPLDFMLLCSSIAGVLGNPAQAEYGAANAFMDAFASERTARAARGERHGATLAVAWPLWADGGMQVDAATRTALQRRFGTVPMPAAAGLAALDRLLAAGAPERVLLQYGAADRIRSLLEPPAPVAASPAQVEAARAAVAVATPASSELLAATVAWLKDLLAEQIQMDAQRIRSNRKLEEYGLDSITIVEMTNRMEEVLGPLSKTLFFEYVDLDGLAGHLVEEHGTALGTLLANSAATPPPAPPAAEPAALPAPAAPAMPSAPGHDIAIVGMSLRVCDVDDAEDFWRMLEQGLHGFERYPAARWDHAALLHPERDVPGKTVVQTGTFLRGIDEFDPRYFRISQAEAELMSPEVRLFLQSCVHAFEDAGYSRETLQRRFGGEVAVIVGSMTNEYDYYGLQNMLRGAQASGSDTGTVPNLSYFYGFTGPSYFLDTMCSGAATCVHEAVQMLRAGRCQLALAGGVNLLLHPHKLIAASQEHFTTKTAEVIRGYGLGADGTILGEGVGAFVLKRLEDAQRDGDHVYGVIKGSAVTNAGIRNGFTVPTPQQQAAAIEKAWQDAAIDPRTIGYIEGHGSGTSLGDPIEVKALTQAFGKFTDARQFVPIGTVKSNVAHLLHAAALPGIAKVLLQMRHGMLAPSLHAQQNKTKKPVEQTPLRGQRGQAPWPRLHDAAWRELPRRAGVTSIGAGGMNAHIVLEEYRAAASAPAAPGPQLCVFSAMTPNALRQLLTRMADWLERSPAAALADIALTLQEGRNELPCRLALVADTPSALLQALRRFLAAPQAADEFCYSPSILEHDVRVDAGTLQQALADAQLARLAEWWSRGVAIDWSALRRTGTPRRLSLPSYPFEQVRCWYPSYPEAPSVVHPLGARTRLHPFLGGNRSDLSGVRYHTVIHRGELLDYAYAQERRPALLPLVLPEMLAALARIAGADGDVGRLEVASAVPWNEGDELVASVAAAAEGGLQLRLAAAGAEAPFAHATLQAARAPSQAFDLPALCRAARTLLPRAAIYQQFAERKLAFKPYLEVIAQAWLLADGGVLCEVDRDPPQQDRFKRNLVLPPHLLGAAWQAMLLARPELAGLALAAMEALRGDAAAATHVLVTPQADAAFFLAADGRAVAALQGLDWRAAAALQPLDGLPAQAAAVIAPARAQAGVPALPDGPRERLTAELRQLVADLLKFPLADISPRALFHDLGFDSISLTRLSEEINARYGSALTPALFYQCEHVEALAGWLAPRLADQPLAAAPTTPPSLQPVQRTEPAAPAATRPSEGTMELAIVGLAARLPGAADAHEFFQHLLAGRDLVGPLPLERYGPAYRARMEAAGFPLQGGFLQDVDRFDAAFFKTSPHEAERMDPQQRLLLETAWHAIENAGYRPEELPADTGVFIGVSGQDYARVLQAHGVETDGYVATGNSLALVANRISWQLNLGGPSEAVDTACSSSLVALLRAADAVRQGRCGMAIVGGVNLALAVEGFEGPWQAGMLGPHGRCRTFSRDADGYVRGEGVVAVLVKGRTAAERDGDRILGLLVGGAGEPRRARRLAHRAQRQRAGGAGARRHARHPGGKHRLRRNPRHRHPPGRPGGDQRPAARLRKPAGRPGPGADRARSAQVQHRPPGGRRGTGRRGEGAAGDGGRRTAAQPALRRGQSVHRPRRQSLPPGARAPALDRPPRRGEQLRLRRQQRARGAGGPTRGRAGAAPCALAAAPLCGHALLDPRRRRGGRRRHGAAAARLAAGGFGDRGIAAAAAADPRLRHGVARPHAGPDTRAGPARRHRAALPGAGHDAAAGPAAGDPLRCRGQRARAVAGAAGRRARAVRGPGGDARHRGGRVPAPARAGGERRGGDAAGPGPRPARCGGATATAPPRAACARTAARARLGRPRGRGRAGPRLARRRLLPRDRRHGCARAAGGARHRARRAGSQVAAGRLRGARCAPRAGPRGTAAARCDGPLPAGRRRRRGRGGARGAGSPPIARRAARRDPLRRRAPRQRDRAQEHGATAGGVRGQGRGRRRAAAGLPWPAAGVLRAVLVARRRYRQPGPGRLRGGQRLPRRAGRARGRADGRDRLALVARGRHEAHAGGRAGLARHHGAAAALHRAGTGRLAGGARRRVPAGRRRRRRWRAHPRLLRGGEPQPPGGRAGGRCCRRLRARAARRRRPGAARAARAALGARAAGDPARRVAGPLRHRLADDRQAEPGPAGAVRRAVLLAVLRAPQLARGGRLPGGAARGRLRPLDRRGRRCPGQQRPSQRQRQNHGTGAAAFRPGRARTHRHHRHQRPLSRRARSRRLLAQPRGRP